MRWLTFAILALMMLVLQSAVAPRITFFGVWPDWLLIASLYFGLYARAEDALLGAVILGGLADLMTVERLGFLALSYGAAVMLVTSARDYLFRYHPPVQFAVVFVVSLMVRIGWSVYRGVLYDSGQSAAGVFFTDCILGSLYTAAWAPLLFKALLAMSRSLGIPQRRYTFAGLHRLRGAGV